MRAHLRTSCWVYFVTIYDIKTISRTLGRFVVNLSIRESAKKLIPIEGVYVEVANKGSINVRLTSCLFCLDSPALRMLKTQQLVGP